MTIDKTGPWSHTTLLFRLFLLTLLATFLMGSRGQCVRLGKATSQNTQTSPTWLRGDFHYHTTYSEDARRQMGDDVQTSVSLCEWAGLDFVAFTDHRTVAHHSDPHFKSNQLVLLAGEEWGHGAHAGAIGIQTLVPEVGAKRVDQAIQDTHRQGGIFIINHPCDQGSVWYSSTKDIDAVEVWNTPWSLKKDDTSLLQAQLEVAQLGFTPNPYILPALAHTGGGSNYQALKFWEEMLNAGRKIPLVGGGDRHMATVPGQPSTYVLAQSRSRKGILDAVRAGRTYVTRGPDGPTSLSWKADADNDGIYESQIGDTVGVGQSVPFRLQVTTRSGGTLEIVKNGQVVHKQALPAGQATVSWVDTPGSASWYRVDIYEPISWSWPNAQAFSQLVKAGNNGATVSLLLNMIAFASQNGLSFAPIITGLPTVIFEDQYNRILNVSPRNPSRCRGAISSPIYAR